MKMIHDVLRECGYYQIEDFACFCKRNCVERCYKVTPFLPTAAFNETYLLVSVAGTELPHLLDGDFLPSVTQELGRRDFYSPDMDRNTTLLLICRCADGERIDNNARVQIEDDPYYFKKYVFAYTEQEETAAQTYIEGQRGSLTEIIRKCLLNTERFAGYKDYATEDSTIADKGKKKAAISRRKNAGKTENAAENEKITDERLAYGFFLELATKITILPIRPSSTMAIRTVEEFWQEELCKKPVANLAAVESILMMDSDTVDDVLEKWNDLNLIVCE